MVKTHCKPSSGHRYNHAPTAQSVLPGDKGNCKADVEILKDGCARKTAHCMKNVATASTTK